MVNNFRGYFFKLFLLSFVSVLLIYGLTHSAFFESQQLTPTEIGIQSEAFVSQTLSNFEIQPVLAQDSVPSPQKGNEININNRKFNVPWIQWNEGGKTRIGITDTGVMNVLGLHLLSSNNPNIQPAIWFPTDTNKPTILNAKFINPYRYLDITELLETAGTQGQVIGNTLNLIIPQTQIQNIRQGNQSWGKRIVIDLDRPTFWSVSQAKNEGVIILEGAATPELMTLYQPLPPSSSSPANTNEDDLGSGSNAQIEDKSLSLLTENTTTKLSLNIPNSQGLNVFSISNPPRLIVDIRPDYKTEKDIVWTPGIIWRQKLISLRGDVFPVTFLEIDLKSPRISLKPITTNSDSLQGTAPIVNIARNQQASIAINGGFFNRNNQLPLGAIRIDNRWISSPILNRGAIAWNNQGKVKLGRLRLDETLITSTGNPIPLVGLNSGYIKPGMARYSPEWGASYTPLTDNEVIILVENNQVIEQYSGSKAGSNSFPIPRQGYLLTIRNNNLLASVVSIGTQVKLETGTTPPEFNSYPYMIGAGPLLLLKGQIVLDAASEGFSEGFQKQKASRSAIATTPAGKLLLVAVHNRVGGAGATLGELAELLRNLGADNALNLDGGSSTAIAVGGQLIDRYPVTAAKVHNGIGIFIN